MSRGCVCITFKSLARRCAVPKTHRELYYTHWRLVASNTSVCPRRFHL